MKKTCMFMAALLVALVATAQTTVINIEVFFGHSSKCAEYDLTEIDSITFNDYIIYEENPNYSPRAFSVSEDKTVIFSQGNLQYQASTDTWRFAERQYDWVGGENDYSGPHGNVYIDGVKCDNGLISDTYDGWIDLFGWGTGDNPTLTSKNNNSYSTFTDLGVNEISNGGNTANEWRTLTRVEWNYLFFERTHAAKLFSLGQVHGVNGLILLPDDWDEDLPFTPNRLEVRSVYGYPDRKWYEETDGSSYFEDNVYTAEEWIQMELAGAVFLPAAGSRSGTDASWVRGTDGYYLSSSQYSSEISYELWISSSKVHPTNLSAKYQGSSVRLVR